MAQDWNDKSFVLSFFGFGTPIPSGSQYLLMSLCSDITTGGQKTKCYARNWIWIGYVQEPYLSLWPHDKSTYWQSVELYRSFLMVSYKKSNAVSIEEQMKVLLISTSYASSFFKKIKYLVWKENSKNCWASSIYKRSENQITNSKEFFEWETLLSRKKKLLRDKVH